jgi:GNAT superfamily N-acetyltransferase
MEKEVRHLNTSDPGELKRAFEVFHFLRPHLDLETFIARVQRQLPDGYKIIYLERDGSIVSAAGYRVTSFLAWGKVLYIDDLITNPEKKRLGLASTLLDWLIEEAKRLQCDEVHLDSGFARHDAHRLYLNKGFILSTHHLSRKV